MYDEAIAGHYAAYRPPAHEVILGRLLEDDYNTATGLDIGCGTGRSAIALKQYCDRVIAIDPATQMLANAKAGEGITYALASGEDLPLRKEAVGLATIAGSLSYMDRMALIDELNRVCAPGAIVLVYDFQVELGNIEKSIGVDIDVEDETVVYDHAANLDGAGCLQLKLRGEDRIALQADVSEVAHLLLADCDSARTLQNRYQVEDVSAALEADIAVSGYAGSIDVKFYYSSYLVTR